jgi:S-adenosylmethionine:tRNA ribosyltransferase-isomerase
LVVPRDGSALEHRVFKDIVQLFRTGDVLVVNESKVMPARLLGRKPTGAPSEILLIRPAVTGSDDPKVWEALVRPGGKLKPGRVVVVSDELSVEIVDSTPDGGRIVRLITELTTKAALDRFGHVPLPPYLDREEEALDRERYQTVYARVAGSIAAPTAGLHFTVDVLDALQAMGVERVAVELQVGVGTFRPVESDDPTEHDMHEEYYFVSPEAAERINEGRAAGGRVWAVGTTVVRTLETLAREDGTVEAGYGRTRLFIQPGFAFRAVDCLITNFHLPRSTLLMLVAAFAGYERMMTAYEEAIREGYRFYSYGDAMVVL